MPKQRDSLRAMPDPDQRDSLIEDAKTRARSPRKKRHHYVPVTYLNSFCSSDGMVRVHFKDDPKKIVRQRPESTAFEKHYYTQILDDGSIDSERLEDLFSQVEAPWPNIIAIVARAENLNPFADELFTFLGLQRLRVPASRDALEFAAAEGVRSEIRRLIETGRVPPPPKPIEDLLPSIEVSIDPQKSLYHLPALFEGVQKIIELLGFEIVLNKTDVSFISSDNPVVYFDPTIPERDCQPYGISLHGQVELLFPLTPDVALVGHTKLRDGFMKKGFVYREIARRRDAKRINRYVARFGYRFVFARDAGHERLVKRFAKLSPTLESTTIPRPGGYLVVVKQVFGQRPQKPKWNPDEQSS